MFETLEFRRLLSAPVVALSGGVLTVKAGGDAANIVVRENAGTAHVEFSDKNNNLTNDFTGVTAINITGSGKADQIYYTGNTIGAVIHGGGEDDSISVTDEGSGHSSAFGDAGNDTITVIVGSQTSVFGGDGNDNIYVNTGVGTYNTSTAQVIVDAGKGNDTITVYDGQNTIGGGAGTDTLYVFGGTNTVNSDVEFVYT